MKIVFLFILSTPFVYGSYCSLTLFNPNDEGRGRLKGECVINEQHYGIPNQRPYLEVLAENRDRKIQRIYEKRLIITSSATVRSPPKFEDPDRDGIGWVRGKIDVDIPVWTGAFAVIEARVDGDTYTLFYGNVPTEY